jgi:putative salt-induced outer membrane protein YdiY
MKLIHNIIFSFVIIVIPVMIYPVCADTIITKNGSTLVGQVTTITPVAVTMETEYAGTITIDTGMISSLSTDMSISTKLEDGTLVIGITEISDDGFMNIRNESIDMRTSMDDLMASWLPDSTPPIEAGFPQERQWHYNVGADITGKRGNSDENGTSVRAEAVLASDNDVLKFYTSVDRADTDGEDTSDEIIFGSSYTSYFSDKLGWYVSSELERDPFESIDLRASVSAGMSYWVYNQSDFSLELQSGFGYRHESFEDGNNINTPILDIRLNHLWQVNTWMNLTNSFIFMPSITDYFDYLLVQDSGITMPIGGSRWSLRLGLQNDYKSEPAEERKKLDTTYYSRLLLNF